MHISTQKMSNAHNINSLNYAVTCSFDKMFAVRCMKTAVQYIVVASLYSKSVCVCVSRARLQCGRTAMNQCGTNRSSLPKCFLRSVDASRSNFVTTTVSTATWSEHTLLISQKYPTTDRKVSSVLFKNLLSTVSWLHCPLHCLDTVG